MSKNYNKDNKHTCTHIRWLGHFPGHYMVFLETSLILIPCMLRRLVKATGSSLTLCPLTTYRHIWTEAGHKVICSPRLSFLPPTTLPQTHKHTNMSITTACVQCDGTLLYAAKMPPSLSWLPYTCEWEGHPKTTFLTTQAEINSLK